MIPKRVSHERDQAMLDVSMIVNEYGEDVILYGRCEDAITRDKYGSIIYSQVEGFPPRFDLKAYPVDHQPNRQQMEKAGIREQCEAIVWFSMKDIIDKGLTFDGIGVQTYTMTIDGNDYGIRDKAKVNPYGDQHLYLTIGVFKK